MEFFSVKMFKSNLLIVNNEKQIIISGETSMIDIRAEYIVEIELKDQKEAQLNHDKICPICQGTKKIVDKIRDVNSMIETPKSLFNSNPILHIKTDAINHCNLCGHEWKKYKVMCISKTDVIRQGLDYLIEILNDETHERFSWKKNTISIFDDCHIDTIYKLYKQHKSHVNGRLTKKMLSKKYRAF
jgi:formate dehydrogenase maturation protein FdhE